jgi:hypothetical protein
MSNVQQGTPNDQVTAAEDITICNRTSLNMDSQEEAVVIPSEVEESRVLRKT